MLAMIAAVAAPAVAQDEAKEKPPMYSYFASWTIPRGQWAEMQKADAADDMLWWVIGIAVVVGVVAAVATGGGSSSQTSSWRWSVAVTVGPAAARAGQLG